jgi:hypothetical protein
MLYKITDFDIVFLSYDEPNAEKHWADLKLKAPWAKRVSGIKGFDAAHKRCAEIVNTNRFITVDGDNIVHENFFEQQIEVPENNIAISWSSRNALNGLRYGNGGLKLWSRDYVLRMQTHEQKTVGAAAVDFCWESNYVDLPDVFSSTYITGSSYQAFRAAFREGVKMSIVKGEKVDAWYFNTKIPHDNLRRLLIWCSVGKDIENGIWALYGARLGCYMLNLTDWDFTNISSFDWFEDFWKEQQTVNIEEEFRRIGDVLRRQLMLRIADLENEQSSFYREVVRW